MTTTINASPEIMNKSENGASIQYLPCSIDFTGTSDIEERFSKFTEKDDDTEILSNSIRGFPLQGKILSVPENYKGIIVESGKSGLTKQDKSARVTSCFEQMTYWNYDRAPSQADAWQQALEWTKVAEALHSD